MDRAAPDLPERSGAGMFGSIAKAGYRAPMAILLLLGGSGVAGLIGGAWLSWQYRQRRLNEARMTTQQLMQQSHARAAEIREQGQRRAAAEQARCTHEAQLTLQSEQYDLTVYAAQLDEREQLLTHREAEANRWEQELQARDQSLNALCQQITNARDQRQALKARGIAALEERGDKSSQEMIQQWITERISKTLLITQMESRALEDHTQEVAASEARRAMTLAIDRYNGVAHLERIQNAFPISSHQTFDALADPHGRAIKVFTEHVGCELQPDLENRVIVVRGDDPLAREIGRRILRQIAEMPFLHADRLYHIAQHTKDEVDREVQNAGKKAFKVLDLQRAHPDIVNLVGRLKYRLSYSQNQWKHAVEVAFLSGMMAEELGVDVMVARRGGLLHDIGKAMTHDHEGSHAVLGADVARRCGENEVVANAIGSHHNDEPAHTAIAHIVTAADAISGARPGARREAVVQYMDRIEEIHRIACQSAAVKRVDIMQAGREVRVIVGGDVQGDLDPTEQHETSMLTDAELHPLAQDIARSIEEQVTFAGQIRVTVIRESRSVAIAR